MMGRGSWLDPRLEPAAALSNKKQHHAASSATQEHRDRGPRHAVTANSKHPLACIRKHPRTLSKTAQLGVGLHPAGSPRISPIELWTDLFLCLDARLVVDLSPGSGVAARAAMHNEIEYIGCCSNETHARWMSNVLDREACVFIGQADSTTDHGGYSALINKHFSEVIEQIKERDEATAPTNQDPAVVRD